MPFHEDLKKAKPFELLIVDLLHSWGVEAGLNPHTDERIAWYDVWMVSEDSGFWIECKDDFASERTPKLRY